MRYTVLIENNNKYNNNKNPSSPNLKKKEENLNLSCHNYINK
jgi:hypothetical protein